MFGESTLSREEREMIAVVVSNINKCDYWVTHHGAALRSLTNESEFRKTINYSENFDGRILAMLKYAEKLTVESHKVNKEDIKKLKEYFTDEGVFEINQVASYFNYVNRIASGLGVEIENEHTN